MISSKSFFNLLKDSDIDFFTGVPDSLLKDICAYITDHVDKKKHIIAANEGNAVSIASGYYLATNKIPLVYMQNSGIGNSINPLVSLTDPEVYSIPALLVIGWRGRPGIKDEPQHVKQGKVTTTLLDSIDIPYEILSDDIDAVKIQIDKAISFMREKKSPFALIVPKGTFEGYKLKNIEKDKTEFERERAIQIVADSISTTNSVVLSTTGKISRELYEHRINTRGSCNDFLNVGSMGHVSQIALGVALAKPNKKVFCFDGDGATLMHMGGLGIIGDMAPENLKHIIFNNGAHESVGGQPTIGYQVDFQALARACNYKQVLKVESEIELMDKLANFIEQDGPSFLEVIVKKGARSDLGRPKESPLEIKRNFMESLNS